MNKGRLTLGGLACGVALGASVLAATPSFAQTNVVAESSHTLAASARQASSRLDFQGRSMQRPGMPCGYGSGGGQQSNPYDHNNQGDESGSGPIGDLINDILNLL